VAGAQNAGKPPRGEALYWKQIRFKSDGTIIMAAMKNMTSWREFCPKIESFFSPEGEGLPIQVKDLDFGALCLKNTFANQSHQVHLVCPIGPGRSVAW
jgi:hypothetical protein